MGDDNGYRVATTNNRTVPGEGGDLARAWLERLRIATAGEDVLPLPYADPDLVALTHNGLQGDLGSARTDGVAVLAELLPSASLVEDTAWPIDGYLDRDTLDTLGREGVTSTVLDGRALPPTIDLSYTPSGRARLASSSGRIAALLADPSLVDLLARPRLPSPVLAAQRVVAETAMITSELPSTGTARTIVAMPPRRWDPPQDFLDQLVTVGEAPWAAPVQPARAGGGRPAGGRPRPPALPARAAPRRAADVVPAGRRCPAGRHRQLPRRAHRSRPAGARQQRPADPRAAELAAPARVVLVAWPRLPQHPAEPGEELPQGTARTGARGARQLHVRQQVRDDPAHPGQRPAAGGRGRAAARPADPPPACSAPSSRRPSGRTRRSR